MSGEPVLAGLTVQQVRKLVAEGAVIVDVRPVADVAAGHIPGAVSIACSACAAIWVVGAITAVSGIVAAVRMYETHRRPAAYHHAPVGG